MDQGPSDAETFSTGFLHKLIRPGLRGVKLVVGDAHEDTKAAISVALMATFPATKRRCRVQFAARRLQRHA